MATICKPAIVLPKNVVRQEEMISLLKDLFPLNSDWPRIEKMIRNTTVDTRHLIRPINEIIKLDGFGNRNDIYKKEALHLSFEATEMALLNAGITPLDIDMIIAISCTGFMMPSITSYLINHFRFSLHTVQLPIAQMGCAAGACAVNKAFEYLSLYPEKNVLIISTEFSSLCFHKEGDVASLISDSIFGDCVTACIVRGKEAEGYKVTGTGSFVLPDSEHLIYYEIKDAGFHFRLDKQVIGAIKKVAPIFKQFAVNKLQAEINELDFYIFHTGGRRILDELVSSLSLPPESVDLSRKSLQSVGNIASGVVFDVLQREFDTAQRKNNDLGFIAAFGPGFTTEYNVGTWVQ